MAVSLEARRVRESSRAANPIDGRAGKRRDRRYRFRRNPTPTASLVSAQPIDGKALAARMRRELAAARRSLRRDVRLVSLQVGHSQAAAVYVRNQQRAATEVGIDMEIVDLPADSSCDDVLAAVAA